MIIENNDNELFLPESYQKSEYINVNDLYEIIFTGGMPEVITRKGLNRDAFFECGPIEQIDVHMIDR